MLQNKYHFLTLPPHQTRWGKERRRRQSWQSQSLLWCGGLVVLALFLFPLVSKAVKTENLEAFPAFPDPNISESVSQFIYNLAQGESKTDGIKVVNLSEDVTIIVKIYSVDALVTERSGLVPREENAPKKEVGNWIKFSTSEVTLEPKEERIIPFTITIPKDTEAGDHLGAIIAEKKGEPQPTEKPGVFIKKRLAIRVIETVPGEIIKDLKIFRTSWGIESTKLTPELPIKEKLKTVLGLNKEGFIIIRLQNKGNVRLKPIANIEIADIFGNHAATLENVSLKTSQRGQVSSAIIKWPNHPFYGRFTANVAVLFGDEQSVTGKVSFWIIPWTILFIIVFLIMIFIFGKLFYRLYCVKLKLKMMPYKVAKKETLTEISDKFNVKWKKLARINNLKPPYDLKVGKTLFIPKKKK